MQLIEQPNKCSCPACAFAMALNMTLKRFIEAIGHAGSEIVFPDLLEQLCRKGFPYPECIRVCLLLNLSATPVDFKPRCGPDKDHWYELDHTAFANGMLGKHQGIIEGSGTKHPHTVAWDGKKIYDSSIGIYDFENPYFKPEMFWIVK